MAILKYVFEKACVVDWTKISKLNKEADMFYIKWLLDSTDALYCWCDHIKQSFALSAHCSVPH